MPSSSDHSTTSQPVHTADGSGAVYGQTEGFTEEETHTVATGPPTAKADRSRRHFPSQPINRPILLRLDGIEAGNVSALDQLPASIGRDPRSRIVVDETGVSRRHASISRVGESFSIEDLGSTNGTYVAGGQIVRSELNDGCLVRIGQHVRFRFALVEERQELLLRQLYRSSTRDALTGTYNRRYFEDRLVAELAYAKRHSAELSLIIIDIDHFKQINDAHGHPTGDVVLQQIALALKRQMRVEDVLSRVGGEEFAVLLRGIGSSDAARLGERLRAAVANAPAISDGLSIPVTISAGCASWTELDLADGRALFSMADARLYAAKHAGRNQVVCS